jgi:nucleotide-binding universal stress UspA family protein
MYKNVLASTDMLDTCDIPVLTAARIAKQYNAKLHILHVLESAYSGKYRQFVKHFETGKEIVSGSEYEETAKAALDKACREALVDYDGYDIKVTPGFPWEETLKLGREKRADLIVLGPHSGRAELKGVARVSGTIGSTVEGIIMRERCPVMIVNQPVGEDGLNPGKIMVCVDFSKSCESALQFAIKLAQKHGSQLLTFHMAPLPASGKYPQADLEKELDDLRNKLETFSEGIPQGVKHESGVWEGTLPHVEILKYAREKGVDLIAMGSHTKEKGKKWYVGSAVEQVSSRSICPVVVVTHPKALLAMGK